MKRILILSILLAVMFCFVPDPVVFAQEEETGTAFKQGFLVTWDGFEFKHLTTATLARTKPIESWGVWNVLWDGWMVDAGFAYDDSQVVKNAAIILGREFGTLGKYLPIDFPFKDKITITLYPVGLYAEDFFDDFEIEGCSGLGIIKFEVKF